MTKRLILAAAVLAATVFVPTATSAAPIVSIVPGFASGNIGDAFTVDIVISNLEGAVVGGFDLDITFDTSILTSTGVTFGSGLGTSITDLGISGGVIDLYELSLLFGTTGNAQLLALQGGNAFTLASLTFQGIANGLSPLNITQAIFSDADGVGLGVDTANGSIQIGDVNPIPEPGTMLLLGSGAALAALRHRRQKRRQSA